MLKFITGNKNKFNEVQSILASFKIEQLDINVDEIQELDEEKIVMHKLKQAWVSTKQECIVEDSSLYLGCLNGKFPGPFLKWFEQALSLEDIFRLTVKMENSSSEVITIFGYTKDGKEFKIFKASLKGTIVSPIGNKDFGYGPIFKPENSEKTYGEMEREEKYQISSRGQAARMLKEYLLNNGKNIS